MVDKEKILKLHEQGLTCKEIRDELGYSQTTIRKYIKEKDKRTNTKITRLTPELLQTIFKYVKEGKTVKEISQILNICKNSVRNYITEKLGINNYNHKRKPTLNKKHINFTQEQIEVLYGTLLGDAYIGTNCKNYRVSINQGGEQEKYFDYKCKIFHNLLGKINKTPRYDKRTQKYYNKFAVRLMTNPFFNELHDKLYINGRKTITQEWLDKMTDRSLAFWFMDDGSNSGVLATNCYTLDECKLVQKWLFDKYKIKTTLQKVTNKEQYLIYIKVCSRKLFYNIVYPYFIPSMLYKINSWIL